MVPQPRRQNPQRQPLTVSLRTICREYPAGAGILKELLQNADDAGASTVKFVLDTSTYRDSPLLVDGLSEYQGPALLAYNDATFTDQDFQSLTSLGDSKKFHDKAATGKFGFGFSSVFNWTDCPSLVSGSTLLFLDPHNSWSRHFDPPGGPNYEFPVCAKDEAMANQLACFSRLNTEWEHPFPGTVIRIPLRNATQAERSEIKKEEATPSDVKDSIDSFAKDMGSSGLLFLKSVRRIVLFIDDERVNEVEVINKHDLIGPQQRLKDLLGRTTDYETQTSGEVYQEVHLRHKVAEQETVKKFSMLNLVAGSIHDSPLATWAASKKLFPWVAVAAPMEGCDSSSKVGRLFSTLPLPCSTGLPIHINGLFSISADRSRLHGLDDNGVQDHQPKEWNKYLFDRLIPMAWAKLLSNMCQTYPTHDHSHLWPAGKSGIRQLWDGLCRAVTNQAFENRLRVWFTDDGYIALEDGLLASGDTPVSVRMAFREAKLPIIFGMEHVVDEARQIPESRILSPRTLYQVLQHMDNVNSLSKPSRLVLLEYLIREVPLTDLVGLKIFPFQDGNFRSLQLTAVYLHRSELEKTLFARQNEATIDIDQLSETALKLMHKRAQQGDWILRYRNAEDLRDYYLEHIANGSGDMIVLDQDGRSTLHQVWMWIQQYIRGELPLAAIGSLWLVPIRGSTARRLVPMDTSNSATWFFPGEICDLSVKIFMLNPRNGPKLLAAEVLGGDISKRLLDFAAINQSLCIKDGNMFENFLEFLAQAQDLLHTAPEDIKHSVLRVLKQLCWSRNQPNSDRECNVLKALCLFRAVQWPAQATDLSLRRHWTDLSSGVAFTGLKKLVPVPPSPEQVFLDVTDEDERALFERLGLFKCYNDVEILEEIAIPAMHRGDYDCMSPNLRLEVANKLFQNYYHLSVTKRSRLPGLAIVPLEQRGGCQSTLSFRCPSDVLDPQQHALRKLYFEDEIALPEQKFYSCFSAVLVECGVVKCLTERVILNRIHSYQRTELDFCVVASRAQGLLQMSFGSDGALSDDLIRVARETKWLPARCPDRSDSFTNASKCRDSSDETLVGHVWHILRFQVDKSWRSILGWHDHIDVDVLISQLVRSIRASDNDSVERTLSYLCQNHSTESYANQLLKLSFVRSSSRKLVDASKVCRRDGEKLMPYIHMVDPRFWDEYTELMKLANIAEVPDLKQLKDVLNALEARTPLNEEDLDVAIEVARIWGNRFSGSVDGLKVPDEKCMLVDVGGLVLNDISWLSDVEYDFVHRKVSPATTDFLKIEPLSEKLRNGDLGMEDVDDDEFLQREEVADGIKDTLDRYTKESIFHEYLANADDCGTASEVNFLVDKTTYGTKHLVTKDLQDLQGPSLLIHNNGVFSAADFEGLKHVGRGSKRDDSATIGKFGRGSQTMFHYTDVPMIISGPSLLILDPLRKHLPFNYRTRQYKAGILVKYANLKAEHREQLAPFEGLWGFDSGQDFYKGTIFRFPLRKKGQGSELLESRLGPDVSMTIDVFRKSFDEARLALLFLRNLTTIDFGIKPNGTADQFEWRTRRGTWPQNGTFSDWANVLVEQYNPHGKLTSTTERWWRVIVDVVDAPANLQHRHKRRMKDVECGIAALVPQEGQAAGSSLKPLKSRFFNCLPLKFESTLPVHIQATFLLSGDRQNIATEETSQDAGSEWNRWLLEQKVPRVYLLFLEDIGRQVGHEVYRYFPVELERQHLLSDIIRISFWNEIKSSSCRLFPVIDASQDSRLPMIKGRRNRTAPNLVALQRAVFDTLEEHKSEALRPLLCNCLEDLVSPPLQLFRHITRDSGANLVTPTVVRGVLKSTTAREQVEKAHRNDNNFLSILLSFITPMTTAEVIDLDGCPILPLANEAIGTLSLKSSTTTTGINQIFYSANAEYHNLFSFASSLFSANGVYERFVEKVLDSGLFNLKTLEKGDISLLLQRKESWAPCATSQTWLLNFWEYMNSASQSAGKPDRHEVLDLDSLQHFPLLLFRHHGSEDSVNSLHYFQNNPAIVHPEIDEHVKLLADFPGLGTVEPGTLPDSIRQAEKSLLDPASINRFLKSIDALGTRSAKSLTEHMRASLKESSIKTLQDIILKVSQKFAYDPLLLSDSIRDIPVWPRISPRQGSLTSREAMVAQNHAFVVPWIKNYHLFTMVNKFHQKFSIDDIIMLEQYVLPALPELISEKYEALYARLVRAIALSSSLRRKATKGVPREDLLVPLTTARLAARQDGKLCLASDLFDQGEPLFLAAFRAEAKNRFLMVKAQSEMPFWYELGICRRRYGALNGADYLACLRALERRLAGVWDQELMNDTRMVLYPLCTTDGSLSTLDTRAWSAIADVSVFPINTTFASEPQFRRIRMEMLAAERSTLCLKDIVGREFAPLCWSQVPFALHEPSTSATQHISSEGRPNCAVVWEHLTFLAAVAKHIHEADIQSFITDLQRTYEHLNLNLQGSKDAFREAQAAIWFNAEATAPSDISLDALGSSWTSLENLLLDSPCDAPPLMMVQSFLGRFSTLLKGLGCKSVYYPPTTLPSPNGPKTAFRRLRELWEEGVLADVTFEAQGRTISAHRLILASRSLYCKTQFHGSWAQKSESRESVKIIKLQDMTYSSLKILIEYCYNEDHDWAAGMRVNDHDNLQVIADKLDGLLDVLVAADRWLMPDLHADAQRQLMMGNRFFIRPDNVEEVSKMVGEANAVELRTYCQEYMVRNAEAILLAG